MYEQVSGTLTDLGITTVEARHTRNWMGKPHRVELNPEAPATAFIDGIFDATAACLLKMRGELADDGDEEELAACPSRIKVERRGRLPSAEWTWDRLREEAQARGIAGRSNMNKAGLRAALGLEPERHRPDLAGSRL